MPPSYRRSRTVPMASLRPRSKPRMPSGRRRLCALMAANPPDSPCWESARTATWVIIALLRIHDPAPIKRVELDEGVATSK